jgi:hypothetical protein
MALCGGKGAILHLSYLPNELVDPDWEVSANSHFHAEQLLIIKITLIKQQYGTYKIS